MVLLVVLVGLVVFSVWSEGRVHRVLDGDTLEFMYQWRPVRVRLWGIDAPEKGQPYGEASRECLARLVLWEKVVVEPRDTDRYGRVVAVVYVDDTVNVNLRLVREGCAWVYRQYNREAVFVGAEEEARRRGLGLWRLPASQRVPPWEWRRKSRGAYFKEKRESWR